MRLEALLQRDLIIEDIRATDKAGVIREFAGLLASAGKVRDPEELARTVLDREAQGSTGIGDGIAIPHAKSASLRESIVAFGRSRKGVDFQTLDGRPAYLFFLLVSPSDQPGEHLKTLARISRLIRNAALRERLLASSGRDEIQRLLIDEDERYFGSR
jgi:PTS system nitrogen regulatory IIA component